MTQLVGPIKFLWSKNFDLGKRLITKSILDSSKETMASTASILELALVKLSRHSRRAKGSAIYLFEDLVSEVEHLDLRSPSLSSLS